jgi:hypothetical protein
MDENKAPFPGRTEAGRFAPGFSGNPEGRPKKKPITAAMERLADKQVPKEVLESLKIPGIPIDSVVTWAEVIAHGVAISAAQGKPESAREFADRVEGKLPQAVSGSLLVMQMRELFDRMSPEELRAYAESGALPQGFRGGSLLLPEGVDSEKDEQ